VNTSSTRVEVVWNVLRTGALDEEQRDHVRTRLASRIDSRGNLRVVASAFRSQARNREAAVERLGEVVRRALTVPRTRRKTRPTSSSVERRLQEKKQLSRKKRDRTRRDFD
jgi:ribosome-associated protein